MNDISYQVGEEIQDLNSFLASMRHILDLKLSHCYRQNKKTIELINNYTKSSAQKDAKVSEMQSFLYEFYQDHLQNKTKIDDISYSFKTTNERLDTLENCFFILKSQVDQSVNDINEIKGKIKRLSKSDEEIRKLVDANQYQPTLDAVKSYIETCKSYSYLNSYI